MRVTFDSNVFVSALNYQGPSARLLELAAVDAFRLQLSAEILDETVRILTEKFLWPAHDVTEVRAVLSSVSQRMIPHVQLDVVKRDPDDNRVLECAQAPVPTTLRRVTRTCSMLDITLGPDSETYGVSFGSAIARAPLAKREMPARAVRMARCLRASLNA